jgi:signal transduction histidine kinase
MPAIHSTGCVSNPRMQSNRTYEYRSRLKWLLIFAWLLLMAGTFWYSNWIITTLKADNIRNLRFQLRAYERAINSPTAEDASFIFTEIQNAEYPIILTDGNGNFSSWRNLGDIPDSSAAVITDAQLKARLQKHLENMLSEHEPIEISYGDQVLSRFYYGEMPIISHLRWLPVVEAILVSIFVLLGYFIFSTLRNHEQNLMWVGMAKETAHQLGTPLSSLLGWVEMLRQEPDNIAKPLQEIDRDLDRLQRVANRFSKIGSKAKLKPIPLYSLLEQTQSYFTKRLPQMGKQIAINLHVDASVQVNGNEDLLMWMFENLIKNAIDAINIQGGKIVISALPENNGVTIRICDNGQGMDKAAQRVVFKPGYSTKKRGWGLGLTLVKRIVEDFHGGRIFIAESTPGRGTCIEIQLPKATT